MPTIAQWTFDSLVPDATTSTGTTSPFYEMVEGVPSLSLVGGTTATFASGKNQITGGDDSGWNTSTYAASGTGDKSRGIEFSLNSTGFIDLQLSFDQRHSNTSANTVVVQYSSDGGLNWLDAQTFVAPTGDTWYSRSVDLSSINALEGLSDARIRIVAAFDAGTGNYKASNSTSSYATTGTWRFDNVTFSASTASTENTAPQIQADNETILDAQKVTSFLSLPDESPSASPVAFVSGVIDDPTDPAQSLGIEFNLGDTETAVEALTVTATSSNQGVVSDGNLILTGTGGSRNLKITPTGVGFADIIVTVSDGELSGSYVIKYAASSASVNPSTSRFHTGTSDASTAIALDGDVMLVADDEDEVIRLYDRSDSGLPLKSFNLRSFLNVSDDREVDIEASTRSGDRLYWIGSHSNSSGGSERDTREIIFSTDLSGTGLTTDLTFVGQYTSLESDLVAWDSSNGHGLGANFLGLSSSSAAGVPPEAASGFSIEGLTFAPDGTTVYVAFRAPLTDTTNRTQALIVPITNFTTIVDGSATSGSASFGAPIQLNLGGRGIRSMERNGTGEYIIIAGPSGSATGTAPNDFRLYTWTGNPTDIPILRSADLTALSVSGGSFEGIVAVPDNLTETSSLQLLVDNGDTVWYQDGTISKDLTRDNFQKFRTEILTLGSPTTEEPPLATVVINEVDADTPGTDAAEFVELYDGGVGNTSLDGLVVVFFNGSNDLSYGAFDLDGYSTDAQGFFVLGNAGVPNVSLEFAGNFLQNGADAVALYRADASDFPTNSPLTTNNLVDALVYDTSDADDTGLLAGLGQTSQFDENANANGANESNSRVPDGTGTFVAQTPTPGTQNQPSFDLQITEIWPGQSGTDLTADWFEITNVGNLAWVSGVDPDLYYDDESADPAEADLIAGLTRLDPGEAAIVLVGDDTTLTPFTTVWGSVIDLTGVEIGFVNGSGLGDSGDAVTLFVGTPGVDTVADNEAFPSIASADGSSYNVTLGAFSVAGENGAVATTALGGIGGTVPAVGSPGNGLPLDSLIITKIHTIQGNSTNQGAGGAHDDISPLTGQVVTIEGVVTGDFQLTNQLRGFFIQEETGDQDADSSTSEGLFIFTGNTPLLDVAEGQIVRVTGTVSEFDGMTQLSTTGAGSAITLIDGGNNLHLVPPNALTLPNSGDLNDYYEQVEGMRVQFTEQLVVSEYFEVARYGQIVLTAGDRPFQYTHLDDTPTAEEYNLFLEQLSRSRLILDDDDNTQNSPLPDGTFFYPQPGGLSIGTQGNNYFRGGDTINGLTGVLHWSEAETDSNFSTDAWRIRPTQANPIQFTAANTRPLTAPEVGGNIKLASFNVLNYFTTIDTVGGNGAPRGADSAEEFERQNEKLIAALQGIDADIFGLVEIENNGTAIQELVDRLNAVVGAGTYSALNTGIVGTDQITVAIIYKPAVVQPQGTFALLTDTAFTDPNSTGQQRNRPAIAQSFAVVEAGNPDVGEVFNVVVNHFKSKGGSDASGADLDQGDGQGQFNDTRTDAASYLVNNWIPSDPTGQGDQDWLIMGDLNAYRGETPITAIKTAGYTDLVAQFGEDEAYSYVFNGQLGYLDHALASSSLVSQVTGVAEWHINADEVPVFDYNNTSDDGAGEASFEAKPTGNPLYEANAFRTSDHDPIIIGMDLKTPAPPAPLFYFSVLEDQTLGVLPVTNEDIIVFNRIDFQIYFDGSAAGLSGQTINAFDIISPTEILISLDRPAQVGGLSVDDSDIIKFTLGENGYQASLYFDGSDVGLTTNNEDIDGLSVLDNGDLLISTKGSFSVPGLSGKGADLMRFSPTTLGSNTTGVWSPYFDGSDFELSGRSENIDALGLKDNNLYLSTTGNFAVPPVDGADEDLFTFIPTASSGAITAGAYDSRLFFDGNFYGLGANDITGLDFGFGINPV